MTKKVTLGAPSLSGKDANDLISAAFGGASFPLLICVTSLFPMPTVFPEVAEPDGTKLSLRSVTAPEGNSKVVVVQSMDRFQRFASSLEQVAELNRIAAAVIVEEVVAADCVEKESAPTGVDASDSDEAPEGSPNPEAGTEDPLPDDDAGSGQADPEGDEAPEDSEVQTPTDAAGATGGKKSGKKAAKAN